METRFGRPSFELWNMASSSSVANDTVILTEDDIPGAYLVGRNSKGLGYDVVAIPWKDQKRKLCL